MSAVKTQNTTTDTTASPIIVQDNDINMVTENVAGLQM